MYKSFVGVLLAFLGITACDDTGNGELIARR